MNKTDMFQNKTLISGIIYQNTTGSHIMIYGFPWPVNAALNKSQKGSLTVAQCFKYVHLLRW